jgi:Family of unknown function (DUF5694)
MLKPVVALIAFVSLGGGAIAAEPQVEVMVLGSYHFGNPGKDVNNQKVDTVLVPKKQAELEAIARALQTFRPTKVMVEMQSAAADLTLPLYRSFTLDRLKTEANEIEQIGFRVAKMAGHADVYGIDEQPAEGEPDYFPYDKLQEAEAKFGQKGRIDAANASFKPRFEAFEANQKVQSVGQMLSQVNDAKQIRDERFFYYGVLDIGDTNTQAGADLNAMWYLRNAKIFAKLMHVAKAGDRVLVVYGGGHSYWLRHFAAETPGYKFVDPVPYLKAVKPVK